MFKIARSLSRLTSNVMIPKASSAAFSSARIEHSLDAASGLNDDQIELRQRVRSFIEKELPAGEVQQMDRTSEYKHFRRLWKRMGDMGLLGVTAPTEYGGLQLGYLEHCVVMEEMSRVCGAIALSYGAHSNLCVNQICLNGSAAQKSRYLPSLVSGDRVGALAMSEAGAGSDVTSMKTTAVRDGDHFVLNGSKFWITNGDEADVVLVYAKTDVDAGKITAFLVDRTSDGFSIGQKIDKLGMRGSPTAELLFDNVRVSADQIVGQLHGGVYVLMSGLDLERLVLAAGPLGLMQAACEQAFDYAHTRQQFGRPIAHFQLLQGKMADMYVRLSSSRSYLYGVAAAVDRTVKALGTDATADQKRTALAPYTKDCAAVILHLAELATQVGLDALQVFGGNGFTNDYPLGRIVRDAKLYEIGAGTSEIRRWLIGRELNKNYS
jgi:isovaleryl-CoA dehydrogenase